MKIKNIGNKVIGIGNVTVLPGKTEDVPTAYETSPILEVYKRTGLAEIIGKPGKASSNASQKPSSDAEALRKARLESLENASEEEVAKIANELGINPAECKDQADVLKKVKAALKK